MANDPGITAEEFESWIPASEALVTASHALNTPSSHIIVERLAVSLLLARAENVIVERVLNWRDPGFSVVIPAYIWKKLGEETYLSRSALWTANQFEVEVFDPHRSIHIVHKFFGVRFDPVGFQKMLPRPPKTEVVATPAPIVAPVIVPPQEGKGGRPKLDFWDDLWAAIAAQLYNGDLKPQRQADIERAMLQWADSNNRTLSEPAARTRARKLWVALNKEDKN